VELPFTNVTAVAGAAEHAVYDANGVLYSCGLDAGGVLGAGRGVPYDSLTPVKVKILNGSDVTALVSSYQNSGAVLSNGQYYDWGLNNEGQLGDGSTANSHVPVLVTLPDSSPVVQPALGGSLAHNGQTLVKLADGTVYGWGDNTYQQLDANGPAMQLTPRRIQPPTGVTYSTLASSGGTTYEITSANVVYARGWGHWGQIGNGTTANAPKPVTVTSGESLISATAKNVVVGC
jgi:alpha-tubulin suppressor-like RCC1 family protein